MQVCVQCLQHNFNTKNKALFISCSLLFVNAETRRSYLSLLCPLSFDYTFLHVVCPTAILNISKRCLTHITTSSTLSLKRAKDNPFSTWKTPVWLSITIKCQASSNLHKEQKLSEDLQIKWKPMLWLQSAEAFSLV